MKTRLIIAGVFGRMGTIMTHLAEDHESAEVVAGVDSLPLRGGLPFPVYRTISQCIMPADAIICFLPPDAEESIIEMFRYATRTATPVVICTTSLTFAAEEAMVEAMESVPVLSSPNMSLGVNLLADMVYRAAKLLHDSGFDIEIIERHHREKLDAPSGTALLLANAANAALDGKLSVEKGRSGIGKRGRSEVGVHAVRGGTITGQHDIIFAGPNEVIEISHSVHGRDIFAIGALKAAQFLAGKPAGSYSMQDVIDGL
jgi:4-hydroxy-tetrahydrodipicolinate reductase